MGKALVFNIPASGHVNPSLPVIAELVRRGEQVIYYLTENYRAKVEATGASYRAYPQFDDTYLERYQLDGRNPPRTAAVMIQVTQAMLDEIIAVARAEAPDYIIYDSMCPWGPIVADILNIPSITSVSLLIFEASEMIKTAGIAKMLSMFIKGAPNILRFMRASKEIGKAYGIKPLNFAEFFNAPSDLMISYTSALIQPNADRLKMNIQFVGPSIDARGDVGDFPLARLNERPVIYISLGTLVNDHPEFFKACIQAFQDAPYLVVMSVGQHVDVGSLGPIPDHFIVRAFNPQLEILQRSALFITHAGMNSVHEGLYYDVPLLLYPQQEEQTFVANRIQSLGAGLRLPSPQASDIRQATETILNTSTFQEQASKLGDSLRAGGGAVQAAELILNFVRTKA